MATRVKAAVSGTKHDAVPAPAWDYANGKRLAVGISSNPTTLAEGLWLLVCEGDDIYYTIQDSSGGDPVADGSSANSIFLQSGQHWAETVVGSAQKIAVIRKTTDAVLWAIPAQTEG